MKQELNPNIKNIILYQRELAKIQNKYKTYHHTEIDEQWERGRDEEWQTWSNEQTDIYVCNEESYTEDQIQDYEDSLNKKIEAWRTNKEVEMPLHECLGMTSEECSLFLDGGSRK